MKQEKALSILCLCDYIATTGFATVSNNILGELRRRFGPTLQLHIVSINYFGKERTNTQGETIRDMSLFQEDHQTLIIPIPDNEKIADPYGRYTFLRLLQEGNYDAYFLIGDPGMAVGMMINLLEVQEKRHAKGHRRTPGVFYFPVDSTPLDTFLDRDPLRNLNNIDQLITFTEYGRGQYLARRPDLAAKLSVMPHGCNQQDFYPIPREEATAFRQSYFGEINARKTIITNVNRNQFRKDIPTTMLAAKTFMDEFGRGEDTFLYLHMSPQDAMGWDLRQVGSQLGLVEGVHYGFPPETGQNAGADTATLRGIYNGSDLFLTTTTGEGWGLTVTEAMMCRLPVIAPAHSSLLEIGQPSETLTNEERMWGLFHFQPYFPCYDSVQRLQCDYEETSMAIKQALDDTDQTGYQVDRAYQYVKTLSWAKMGYRWEKIFRGLFGN